MEQKQQSYFNATQVLLKYLRILVTHPFHSTSKNLEGNLSDDVRLATFFFIHGSIDASTFRRLIEDVGLRYKWTNGQTWWVLIAKAQACKWRTALSEETRLNRSLPEDEPFIEFFNDIMSGWDPLSQLQYNERQATQMLYYLSEIRWTLFPAHVFLVEHLDEFIRGSVTRTFEDEKCIVLLKVARTYSVGRRWFESISALSRALEGIRCGLTDHFRAIGFLRRLVVQQWLSTFCDIILDYRLTSRKTVVLEAMHRAWLTCGTLRSYCPAIATTSELSNFWISMGLANVWEVSGHEIPRDSLFDFGLPSYKEDFRQVLKVIERRIYEVSKELRQSLVNG